MSRTYAILASLLAAILTSSFAAAETLIQLDRFDVDELRSRVEVLEQRLPPT